MRLPNKIAIVTGAAQGIGLATALKFAREGAACVGCVVDVTDRVKVDAMVASTLARFGRIDVLVNNAVIDVNPRGQTNYAATRFGVIGITKTWSRELGPKGIRVNAVAPGFIETPILATVPEKVLQHMREQVPLHRLGKAEEIANVHAFLASDEASYVNGAVIEVSSGGMTV